MLNMEAVRRFETSINSYQVTNRYMSEDSNLHAVSSDKHCSSFPPFQVYSIHPSIHSGIFLCVKMVDSRRTLNFSN